LKTILLLAIVAALLLIAYTLHRSRRAERLNIAPDAQREIQKARQR
jgi:hypothetical protein